MKALFKSEAGPGLQLVDLPEPEIGPEDVKIRVLRTGICGTDLHIQRWDDWAASAVKAPLIPGHEFFGEVVEVGPLVHDVSVGDQVSGEGHIVTPPRAWPSAPERMSKPSNSCSATSPPL
jgi:threonine 3-dehydrogenase